MKMRERYRLWRQYRRMVREVGDYRHHELSDLGIARADIDRLDFDAVYGLPAKTADGSE